MPVVGGWVCWHAEDHEQTMLALKVLKSLVVGPLEPYAAGFAAELERQGYTTWVAEKQVSLAAHLSRISADVDSAVANLLFGSARDHCHQRLSA